MAIPRRELRGHKCLRSGVAVNSYDFHGPCTLPLSTPIGGPRQPHTAPRTTNQTDRHTRKPNLGRRRQDMPLRRPDHRTTTTLRRNTPRSAGPRAAPPRPPQHSARIALMYPLMHRPTPSRRRRHSTNPITSTTHALPSFEDLNASKLNLTGLSGALTIYAYLIFLCTGRVPGQSGLARPAAPRDRDPTSYTQGHRNADIPTTCQAHHL